MWQASGPMMYDLLALLNGALCSTRSHVPPFYRVVDSEGQEKFHKSHCRPGSCYAQVGQPGTLMLPRKSRFCVLPQVEYLFGNDFPVLS